MPGPSCSCGALLLTSRFLALPLAFLSLRLPDLPLLLPDLLAFLSLVLPDLLALLAPFRIASRSSSRSFAARSLCSFWKAASAQPCWIPSPSYLLLPVPSPVRGPGCVLAPQLYAAGVQCKTILPGLSSHLVILRLQYVPRANALATTRMMPTFQPWRELLRTPSTRTS